MSYKNHLELQVCVNGKPVKEYYRNGVAYVEGKQGSRYSLKLKNNTAVRVLAVISVDGIDVLKGGAAEEADSGYILNGYGSLDLKGYRVNDNDVAEFVFSDKQGSYAKATTKNTANCGVIGVRFFGEAVPQAVSTPPIVIHNYPPPPPQPFVPATPVWPRDPFNPYPWQPTWVTADGGGNTGTCDFVGDDEGAYDRGVISGLRGNSTNSSIKYGSGADQSSNLCSSAQQSVPDFNLGTKWGDKIADPVTKVPFTRGCLVAEIAVYYDTRRNLEKIGIDFGNHKQVYEPSLPKAFGSSSYCKPPQGWNQ